MEVSPVLTELSPCFIMRIWAGKDMLCTEQGYFFVSLSLLSLSLSDDLLYAGEDLVVFRMFYDYRSLANVGLILTPLKFLKTHQTCQFAIPSEKFDFKSQMTH